MLQNIGHLLAGPKGRNGRCLLHVRTLNYMYINYLISVWNRLISANVITRLNCTDKRDHTAGDMHIVWLFGTKKPQRPLWLTYFFLQARISDNIRFCLRCNYLVILCVQRWFRSQNCKTMRKLKRMLWTNQISRYFSLRCVSQSGPCVSL